MDDIGKNLQRRSQPQLADNLACAGCDHVAPIRTPRARSASSLSAPTVKVMDVARAVGVGQRFPGATQRLGRHAARIRALPADEFSLDYRQRQPAALKADRDGLSGDATTETDDIKLSGHMRRMLLRRAIVY